MGTNKKLSIAAAKAIEEQKKKEAEAQKGGFLKKLFHKIKQEKK